MPPDPPTNSCLRRSFSAPPLRNTLRRPWLEKWTSRLDRTDMRWSLALKHVLISKLLSIRLYSYFFLLRLILQRNSRKMLASCAPRMRIYIPTAMDRGVLLSFYCGLFFGRRRRENQFQPTPTMMFLWKTPQMSWIEVSPVFYQLGKTFSVLDSKTGQQSAHIISWLTHSARNALS